MSKDGDLKVSFSVPGELDSCVETVDFFCDICAYYRCDNLKKYLTDPPMHLIMYHCDDKRKRPINEPTEEQLRDIAIRSAKKWKLWKEEKKK